MPNDNENLPSKLGPAKSSKKNEEAGVTRAPGPGPKDEGEGAMGPDARQRTDLPGRKQ